MSLWRRYRDGIPEYLARHYWWAYLAPAGVWFFDHHFIIDLILFRQYRNILDAVMRRYAALPPGRTLQLTCAYGALTPTLAASPNTRELHLMDAAAIQLKAARRKVHAPAAPVLYTRANAEALAYARNSFDTVVIFFLLHELPPAARARALAEALRVLKPGGNLLLAEYGKFTHRLFLHRFRPARWLLERLEPFLRGFWRSDLAGALQTAAEINHKALVLKEEIPIWRGFYRVLAWQARRVPGA